MNINEAAFTSAVANHPLFPHIVSAVVTCYKIGADEEEEKTLDELARLHLSHCEVDVPERNSEDRSCNLGKDPQLDLCLEIYVHLLREFVLQVENLVASASTFCQQMKQKVLILCPELGDSLGRKHSESGSVSGDADLYFSQKEVEEMILREHVDQANDSAISPHTAAQLLSDEEWRGAILATYDPTVLKHLKKKHLKEGRKNAKLPDPARGLLMNWWKNHTGNPYPTEEEKNLLAKEAGLEIDQINNWFINQRKRHCCTVFTENRKSHSPTCYKMIVPRR